MLEHTFLLVSDNKIAIPKKYDRLITSLRTAQAEDYNLKKEDTVNDDDLRFATFIINRCKVWSQDITKNV